MVGLGEEELGVLRCEQELDLEVEDLLSLLLGFGRQSLVAREELHCGLLEVRRIDTPGLTQGIHDVLLRVHD